MATDRGDDVKPDKKKTPRSPVSVPPSDPPESSWIMHGLNQIQQQIDKVEQRIQKQINGLETRLRRLERLVWVTQGVVITIIVIWAIVQFVLSNYQVSIMPRP